MVERHDYVVGRREAGWLRSARWGWPICDLSWDRALRYPGNMETSTNYTLYQRFLRELERGFAAHQT